MNPTPILYIVDTPLITQALLPFLRQHVPHVHPLDPGGATLPPFPPNAFLLVEVRLPDHRCGLHWAHRLHRQAPHLHIMPWTTHPSPFHLWLAYHWGFPAFLDKAMPAAEMLHHLRLLLQGQASWPLHLFQRAVWWGQTIAPILTSLSLDLWHLWEGLLQGEDMSMLSQRLELSEGTVRRKRKDLFGALGVQGWAEAVGRAWEWGLVEVSDGRLAFRPVVWEAFGG